MKIPLRRVVAAGTSLALVVAGASLLAAAPASASQQSDPGPANKLPSAVPSAITHTKDRTQRVGK